MIRKQNLTQIFKSGSTTFFNSSLFFPENVKKDVYVLYGFVRVADNLVDKVPQDTDGFMDFRTKLKEAFEGKIARDPIIDDMVELSKRKNFDIEWIKAFMDSMADDLCKQEYETMDEVKKYIYGSANVIGFMMARILDLPIEAIEPAGYLGQAFQYINFLRDIKEDIALGRRYLPKAEMNRFELESLEYDYVKNNKEKFEKFMQDQLGIYYDWQFKAEQGFKLIPKRYRVPIKTAADMYRWTGQEIYKNPMIVYEKKVKPKSYKVKLRAMYNFATSW